MNIENKWPKLNPHEHHSEFEFDENTNNPVKDGKLQLGHGRPPETANPQTPDEHWATFSNKLITKVESLNRRLFRYKKGTGTKKDYDDKAKEIETYIKNGGNFDDEHVDKGSVTVDAIEAEGFTIGIRLYGVAKGAVETKHNHSSSSYYSFYSACQGS